MNLNYTIQLNKISLFVAVAMYIHKLQVWSTCTLHTHDYSDLKAYFVFNPYLYVVSTVQRKRRRAQSSDNCSFPRGLSRINNCIYARLFPFWALCNLVFLYAFFSYRPRTAPHTSRTPSSCSCPSWRFHTSRGERRNKLLRRPSLTLFIGKIHFMSISGEVL